MIKDRTDAQARSFRIFIVAISAVIVVLFGIVAALMTKSYQQCGTVSRCPVGWDIAL